MKDKARALHDSKKSEAAEVEVEGGSAHGPMYRSIMVKLNMLKPEELKLEDESYKHAGRDKYRTISSILFHSCQLLSYHNHKILSRSSFHCPLLFVSLSFMCDYII